MSDFIIAVDFDGTIVDHQFPLVGQPIPYAIYWLKRFQELDAKLILWTMRSHNYLDRAVEVCKDLGLVFWGVNKNHDQHFWTTSPKVYANVYIDDAAVGCPMLANSNFGGHPYVDWRKVGPDVEVEILNHREAKKIGSST